MNRTCMILQGRGGKGNIFVMAGGNGGGSGDHCGADGYVQNEYMISINSVDPLGEMPYFDEACAGLTAGIYLGGDSGATQESGALANQLERVREVSSKYGLCYLRSLASL